MIDGGEGCSFSLKPPGNRNIQIFAFKCRQYWKQTEEFEGKLKRRLLPVPLWATCCFMSSDRAVNFQSGDDFCPPAAGLSHDCLFWVFLPASAVPPAVELFLPHSSTFWCNPAGEHVHVQAAVVGSCVPPLSSAVLHRPDQFLLVDLQLVSSRLCLVLFSVPTLLFSSCWALLSQLSHLVTSLLLLTRVRRSRSFLLRILDRFYSCPNIGDFFFLLQPSEV